MDKLAHKISLFSRIDNRLCRDAHHNESPTIELETVKHCMAMTLNVNGCNLLSQRLPMYRPAGLLVRQKLLQY